MPCVVLPTGRRGRYPRPWWQAGPRFVLLLAGTQAGILYIWAVGNAAIHHTLHGRDRSLLSLTIILPAVLLTAGGLWAIRDMARERIAEEHERKALRRVPFAARAEQRWRTDLDKARAQGDRRAEEIALGNIGFFLNRQERYVEAEPYLTQALALARTVGDRFREERDLCDLARCAIARGDADGAEALYREGLAVALKLTRESLPFAHPDDADVLDEVADTYAVVGSFLVEQRGQGLEGRRMLAEAEARYREEARVHELAAQAKRRGSRRRAIKNSLRRRALELAQDMRDLQRQYDGG